MSVEIDGRGTQEDPLRISSLEELQAVNHDRSAHYVLVSNIDATNSKPKEFEPIGDFGYKFTGIFNGNNYEIQNLCIKRPEQNRVGLFGCIGDEGQVRNLGLTNAIIDGESSVGSLAGSNQGYIQSSYAVGGDVSGDRNVGGLAGCNSRYHRGKIESSYAFGGDVSGDKNVGGLVGENSGRIDLSYVQGYVRGDKNVGGLVAKNFGEVESCYVVEGGVLGEEDVGSLIGWNHSKDKLESCFTFSNADEPKIPEKPDLVMSKGEHRISYVVERNTLYLQANNKIYHCGDVSPVQVQSLLDDEATVEITDKFKSSVVRAR